MVKHLSGLTHYRLLATLLLTVVFASCSSTKTKPHSPVELPELVENTVAIEELWQYKHKQLKRLFYKPQLYFSDDTLFFPSRQSLIALNKKSGTLLWEKKFPSILASAVAGFAKHIYVIDSEPNLYKIEAATGSVIWQKLLESESLAPVSVNESYIVTKLSNGLILALSPEDGSELWRYQTENPILMFSGSSRPIIDYSASIFSLDNGTILAIDNSLGIPIWSQRITLPEGKSEIERLVDLDSDPILQSGKVIISGYNGNIAALNSNTGKPEWYHSFSTNKDLATYRGMAVAISQKSEITVFNIIKGNELWKSDAFLNRKLSNAVINRDYVIVADFKGYIHFLDRKNGKLLASHRVAKKEAHLPLYLEDNILYLFTRKGAKCKLLTVKFGK